jgi:hypothetical protein
LLETSLKEVVKWHVIGKFRAGSTEGSKIQKFNEPGEKKFSRPR